MTSSDRAINPRARRLWVAVALTALATLATLVALPSNAHGASAARSAGVVKVATRGHFGKILVTVGSRTLYKHPHGPCAGSCLMVWPPLLMPRGKTVPKGIKGLRTVKLASGRLQVTYRHRRLYTFVSDSGSSVNGNGVAGFVVAKVIP